MGKIENILLQTDACAGIFPLIQKEAASDICECDEAL